MNITVTNPESVYILTLSRFEWKALLTLLPHEEDKRVGECLRCRLFDAEFL